MNTHAHSGGGNPIADFVARTFLGPRQFHKSLSIWPLVLRAAERRDVEAMESGALRVDEIGDGAVQHVRVTNDGAQPVLFLFGEEIVGAKQNRVANATFLVAPHSDVELDVSCVEAGRWSHRPNARFAPSGEVLARSLRLFLQSAMLGLGALALGTGAWGVWRTRGRSRSLLVVTILSALFLAALLLA